MKGRWDSSFFEKINPCLICFLAAAIQYCLKEWKKREIVITDFKFKTASGKSKIGRTRTAYWQVIVTYHRLRNTWGQHSEKVRKLLLANIKADLRTKVGGYDRRSEIESSIPSVIVEDDGYEEELEKELEKTLPIEQLPVPVPDTDRQIEIPDSQEVISMERTNVGMSQLWDQWGSQEKVEAWA